MDLVPKHLIIGLYTPTPGTPGTQPLTLEKLNQIWMEVTSTYDYRVLRVAPDRTAGVFEGASEHDGVTIQPPLLQVRASIDMTSGLAADKANDILRVIARHLDVQEFYNLGIRLIFHAVVPDGDSRALILHRVMGKTDQELEGLESGGGLVGGVKFFVNQADGGRYALVIEPLFADQRFLYLDLDAQFTGSISDLQVVKDRATEVESYLSGAIDSFLSRFV